MKQLLQQYAAYNLWANKVIIQRITQVSEEQLNWEIISSFPSVYKTVVHLTNAEDLWWQRFRLIENPAWMSENFSGNFEDLTKEWLKLSQQWYDWVKDANEANLTHVFAYYNSKKEYFKQPVYEMILHLFNHQTFHRGQLVTMLRQLGIDKIPATDFIVWSRKGSKQ